MKEMEFNVDSYEANANGDRIRLIIYTDCEEVVNKFSHDEIIYNIDNPRELFEKLKLMINIEEK